MNKPAPKIYRTTNWSTYNRALINRGNIAIWFDPKTQWYAQPKSKHGRNRTYSDTAIQCCLMIKSLFRLSLRMVTGFVQSLIKLCGLDWAAPDYSTICRRQKHIDIQINYEKSCNGLHLLIDSTGLKFLGEGEWKRKKHQPEYHRQWRKLHIGIDAKTLQIRAVQLTTNNVSDSQVLGDLLDQIPLDEQIDSVYTDGAYDTKQCRQVIADRQARFHPEKMQSHGKTTTFIRESEMNYFEQLNVSAGHYGKNGQAIIAEVWSKPRCIASNY